MCVSEVHTPLDDGSVSRAFISRGFDPTSHFESTIEDVLAMYKRITGKELDLSAKPPGGQEGGEAE